MNQSLNRILYDEINMNVNDFRKNCIRNRKGNESCLADKPNFFQSHEKFYSFHQSSHKKQDTWIKQRLDDELDSYMSANMPKVSGNKRFDNPIVNFKNSPTSQKFDSCKIKPIKSYIRRNKHKSWSSPYIDSRKVTKEQLDRELDSYMLEAKMKRLYRKNNVRLKQGVCEKNSEFHGNISEEIEICLLHSNRNDLRQSRCNCRMLNKQLLQSEFDKSELKYKPVQSNTDRRTAFMKYHFYKIGYEQSSNFFMEYYDFRKRMQWFPNSRVVKKPKLTKEQLDHELDIYMSELNLNFI